MKKLVVISIVAGLVLALGAAFANQNSASHGVDIRIPNVLFLRITDGESNARVTDAVVRFNFTADAATTNAYLDHVTAVTSEADAWIGSTDTTPAFGDVVVFSNRNESWVVTVQATAFATTGFDLSSVRVTPSGANESGATRVGSWTLSTAAQNVATGGAQTLGWKPLGISANDYEVRLDGSELPGDYETTVTYTIAQP